MLKTIIGKICPAARFRRRRKLTIPPLLKGETAMGEKKFLDPDEKPLDAIERALLKRALGFHQQEIHTEEMIDKNSGEVLETARRRSVTKEVVPDVRALLFWLKNRRPERWRERRETEEKSPEFDFDSTDEQL